jgi:hypothetical protein
MTRVTIGKSIPSRCSTSVQCRLGQSVIRVIFRSRIGQFASSRALERGARAAIRRRARLQRRHVGHGAVMSAVRLLGNRTAAEVKIGVTRIAARPAAGLRGERADLFSGGQARAGEGGYLGARRRRLDAERGGRPSLGAAVDPGGDGDRDRGGLLDLGNRHCPSGQEASQDDDSAWDAAITVAPASDASWADAEQPSNACDAERAERAEFGCGRVNDHDDVI